MKLLSRPRLLTLATLFGVLGLAPGGLQAQVLGEIQGYVETAGGEPVPGVQITVENQETGAERGAFTDADGFFRVRSLSSGTYTVTAALEGMQTVRRPDVRLLVGQTIDLDLEIGMEAQEEVITVTAETPLVETARSSAASYITEQEIDNIPIVGRDFKQFALLAPTVLDDPQRGFLAMSGQRGIYSGMRIDGTSGKNAFFGYGNGGEATESDGLVIGQESVKEFQIIQNGFAPEYGMDGGGFVNVITKSGTNEFHGTAFFYTTDDGLKDDIDRSPVDLFRDPGAQPFDPSEFERDNFGLTAGGPIARDKVHWFFSYDETDRSEPRFDRLSTRGAFDAILLRAQEDPAFAALVEGYEPNNDGVAAPDPVNGRTATGQFDRQVDNKIYLGKLDFFPTSSHSASIRANVSDYERTSSFLDEESLKAEEVESLIGSWVWVTSAKGLNDFRFQFATDDLARSNLRVGSPIEAQIRFRFGDSDSVGKFDFLPILADTTQFQLKDSYSYLFGEHDLKFGVDFSSDNMEQLFAGSKDGRYDFFSMEDFLANRAGAVRIYFGDVTFPNYDETQDVWALFAQDTWRPNPRWTVNYGVRFGGTNNPGNLEHVFEVGRGIPDDSHLAPRVGFTYMLDEESSSIIRGGFGVFYGRTPTLLFASQVQENGIFPNFGRVVVEPGDAGFVPLGQPIDNENPPRDTIPSTSWLAQDFRDAKNTRYNFGYERRLGDSPWTVALDLLYAEGRNLQRNFNDNVTLAFEDEFGRPIYESDVANPDFNTLFVRRSIGNSQYKAATIKINRRFTGRYSFQAHYTWSRDKDDDSNERNATDVTVSHILEPGYDWGLSDRDVENRLVAVGTARLPLGFQVGGTVKLQSGRPWTAIDENIFLPNFPRATAIGVAPYAVIDGQLVERNSFRNDSIEQVDVRFAWAGDFGRGEVEVFAEVFNLFDEQTWAVDETFNFTLDPFDVTSQQHPTLRDGSPNPEFGLPDQTVQDSRFWQFGVRLRL